MKTIGISEELHKEIMQLRIQRGIKTVSELLNEMLFEYKQKNFLESSTMFREGLEAHKISFDTFLKKSKLLREEIADEWF